MKWRFCFRVSQLSFCCLASVVSLTSAASTNEATSAEEPALAGILDSGTWRLPNPCYVEKSKVNALITRMNQTVQILNTKDAFLKCNEKIEAAVVDADDIKLCDDDRILKIQKDLSEVAAGLFRLAIRFSEPSEEDVDSLDRKKFQLVYDLRALRVFYGPSPCNENSIALYPFQLLVEYVEWNLNQIFVLFQEPSKLIEIAKSNPDEMSRALPRIVSQRYSEKISTFDKLLNFAEGLSTMENQIIGVSAIHDEMYRFNRNPEPVALVKIAKSVKRLNQSVSSAAVNETAISKLTDLLRDPDLSPIFIAQDPRSTYKELTESARLNPAAMSIVLPGFVSQRYNASVSSFKDLLKFIEGLPTAENKIFGFAALYDETNRFSSSQFALQMLKMAKTVKRLNETAGALSGLTSAAQLKLADLVHNLSPLIVIGEKAECEVTNVAYQLQLYATDWGSPYSAYLDTDAGYWIQVYPKVEDGRLVFRFSISVQHPFYASDTNPNTDSRNTKYQTQPSERYVLYHRQGTLPSDADLDWKLVPIKNKKNQFKIMSAKSDDFMFAHQSATGFNNYRRVLLGRKNYSSRAHIPEADNWTFECTPGTFTIPVN